MHGCLLLLLLGSSEEGLAGALVGESLVAQELGVHLRRTCANDRNSISSICIETRIEASIDNRAVSWREDEERSRYVVKSKSNR